MTGWDLAIVLGGGVLVGAVILLVRLSVARKRAARRAAYEAAPWWWERIRCTCAHAPDRHALIVSAHDGRTIGSYDVTADEAHQLARRVFDQAFGFRSGEFVGMTRELEFTTVHGSIVTLDVLTVGSVEIAGYADGKYA